MATNFPTSLDTLVNPLSGNNVSSPSHAAQHTNANDAIEALEAKVGITNSAVSTSHDYRISQVEALVGSAVSGSKSIVQDVRNQSGVSLTKATPVYVSGSTGASGRLLVSPASNSSESTSSKTMGLTSSTISNNSNGQVVSEGILEGIDTTGAVDGDPVWLGTSGQKIYGLANKPYGSAHLVFLGIVIRGGQQNTGSMYVKIQNGFEIEELHNVSARNPATGDILVYNATTGLWALQTSTTFVTTTDLGNSLGDYIPIGDVGQADGVASLDSSGYVPDTQIASTIARTSDISTAISNLIDGAPAALDTLNELAAAINDDSSYASTITTALGTKAPIASPTFTGTVILPNNTVTNAMLAGSIDNNKLSNSSIIINGSSVSLGGSVNITGLPSQTGNTGKYLTTDGSTASWETVSGGISTAKVYFMKG